jgi:hypothetical protein
MHFYGIWKHLEMDKTCLSGQQTALSAGKRGGPHLF